MFFKGGNAEKLEKRRQKIQFQNKMWPQDCTSIFNYKILAGSLQEEFVLHYINIRNTSQTFVCD